ncbi:MAG: hypothetical protein ACRDS0_24420 [Pseudonocardiaceae bacterium]
MEPVAASAAEEGGGPGEAGLEFGDAESAKCGEQGGAAQHGGGG